MVSSSNPSVVTFGETMVRLSLPGHAHPALGAPALGIGGAESNVAISAARLGVDSTWLSVLGDDDFGDLVEREIRGQGVRVLARRDPVAPTGLLVKEFRGGRPSRVRYYRAGSAAAGMTAADVDDAAAAAIAAAGVLHLTGITPALGPGPTAAAQRAIEIARAAGVPVSVDVNYRSSLWSADRARPALLALIRRADVLFAGSDEAALVLDRPEPVDDIFRAAADLAAELARLGPGQVVLKLGRHGALARRDGAIDEVPAYPVTVVDTVGAGDAFVGAYLATLVRGQDVKACLDAGARMGALVCAAPGDWEGVLDWPGSFGPPPHPDRPHLGRPAHPHADDVRR